MGDNGDNNREREGKRDIERKKRDNSVNRGRETNS